MQQIAERGPVKVFEHQRDMSTQTPQDAMNAYFASAMNVRKRQVLIELNGNAFTISAGAMQWISGDVNMAADVKGIGDNSRLIVAALIRKRKYTFNKERGKQMIQTHNL